jgi:hypothetical protein
MGGPTESLTLSTSEHTNFQGQFHKEEGVSSLSDILEAGIVPQRFYLSATACQGILNRAERRSKTLPPELKEALEQAIASSRLDNT